MLSTGRKQPTFDILPHLAYYLLPYQDFLSPGSLFLLLSSKKLFWTADHPSPTEHYQAIVSIMPSIGLLISTF